MHPATTPAPPRRSGRSRRTLLSAALALLAALLLTPALAQAAGGDAAGTWVGAIGIPGAPLGVQVTLAEGEPWTGTIDIPAQGAVGIPLEPVSVDAAGVTFVIAGVPGQATFQGAVDGDTLSGSFTQAGQAFPFTLERAEASDAASAAPTPGPDVEASAGEHADPQGRFTIAVPTGWSASERDGYLRVEGPEGPEGPTGPAFAQNGFSAFRQALSVTGSDQIDGWSVADPYYTGSGFDASSGNYTVPASGKYSIKATINYSTTVAISVTIGSANPSFAVRRTSAPAGSLVSGLFPVLNLNVALLTIRAILGNGMVTLAGDVDLVAGDIIDLFYESDGLTLTLDLGGEDDSGIVWSMHQIAEP